MKKKGTEQQKNESHQQFLAKLWEKKTQFNSDIDPQNFENLQHASDDSDEDVHDPQYQQLLNEIPISSQQSFESEQNLQKLFSDPRYVGKKSKFLRNQQQEFNIEDDDDDDIEQQGDDDLEDDDDDEQGDNDDEDEDEQLEEDDSQQDDDDNEQEDQDNEFAGLKQAVKGQLSLQQNYQLGKDVEKQLQKLKEEDKEILNIDRQAMQDEKQKAIAVRHQLMLWKDLVDIRFQLNKPFEKSKQLPLPEKSSAFLVADNIQTKNNIQKPKKDDTELDKNYNSLILIQNIQGLTQIRQNLLQRSATAAKLEYLDKSESTEWIENLKKDSIQQIKPVKGQSKINTKSIGGGLQLTELCNQYENINKNVQPWLEECILQWSQKTALLTANLQQSGLSSLMHTPFGQAQKAMSGYDKLLLKSQLKRNTFRILGEELSDVQQDLNDEIFDDGDYYHELLQNQLIEAEEEDREKKGNQGQQDFLFNSTQLYLLQRKLKSQEQQHKEVERQASKGRKVRFQVHSKLVNFMNPQENIYVIESRNEIIQNLLGVEGPEVQQEEQKEVSEPPQASNDSKKILQTDKNNQKSKGRAAQEVEEEDISIF